MIAQPLRNLPSILVALAAALLLSACGSTPPAAGGLGAPVGAVPARPGPGQKAAAVALQQVGVPYRYGGSTPSGFDCSGLVQFAYAQAGKRLPRTTGQLWTATRAVPDGEMEIGDVLFFNVEGKMSHVGLYLGDDRFVHAPSSGRQVTVGSLDAPFYRSALIRAGRPR